jgi:predicted nucleic acid-binding protein
VIFDTDVVVWYLRGHIEAARMLAAASCREISVVSMLELVRGMRNKRELAGLKPELARLDISVVPLSEGIGVRALELMERHSLKDGLDLADALIAATAFEAEQPFATANEKHYRPLGLDLHIFKP